MSGSPTATLARGPGTTPAPAARARLDRDGYLELTAVLPEERREALLARLVSRRGPGPGAPAHLPLSGEDPEVAEVLAEPRVVGALAHLLGGVPRLTRVECRCPGPGQGRQDLHVDHAGPIEPGDHHVANVLVLLADVSPELGATRLVPGSHRRGRVPPRSLAGGAHPGEVRLHGPAGTAFVFNGHAWHSGTRNEGEAVRWAVLATFSRAAPGS